MSRANPPDHAATPGPSRRYASSIFEAVAASARPSTANEVFERLCGRERHPGLATVYRSLRAFDDAGILHAIAVDRGLGYRRCSRGAHDHLVCEQCGRVVEIPGSTTSTWFLAARAEEFSPPDHAVHLVGVCCRCESPTDGYPA